MSILYVIGNGFDRWHHLPTSYMDFYSLHKEDLNIYAQYFSTGASTDSLWHNFEDDLGTFDCQSFYDDHDFTDVMSDNFRMSERFGLEDDLRQEAELMVGHFEDVFREWIESIDVTMAETKFSFVNEARFLSFNYTSLLNSVYGIDKKNILHIHGCVDDYESPVFGHGVSFQEEEELDEDGNSNRHLFWDAQGAAKYPLHKLKKPVEEIIDKLNPYFDSLKGVHIIAVLGHSLNDTDLPYFRKISVSRPNSFWVVTKHPQDDGQHHVTQLNRCGILPNKFILCSIDDVPKILSNLILSK